MNIVYVKKKRRLYDYIFLSGSQSYGEFGNNYISNVSEPFPYNNSWKQIETNYYYTTLAIDNNSNLWGWGANGYGILQNEDMNILQQYPVLIDSGENWSSISMGENHCMAIKSNGTLWGIGSNTKAQLGIHENELQKTPLDINVSGIADIVSDNNGLTFFIIKTNGTLWGWGTNNDGRLGLGDTTQRTSPVQVGTDTNWASVSCSGNGHTLAIKTNGTLWAWGSNNNGQLGLGDTTQRTSPVQVGTDTNWASVSCGFEHTLAIKTNGTLWAWGNNNYRQLGLGNTTQRTSPVQVGTDTNWEFVFSHLYTNLAIKTNGTLWTWGSGTRGRGGIEYSSSPVQIGQDTDWVSGQINYTNLLLLKSDGTLWACGNNAYGLLGNNTNVPEGEPIQIGNDTDWNGFSLSLKSIYAIKNNNLYFWGNNTDKIDTNLKIHTTWTQIGTDTDWESVFSSHEYTFGIKTDGTLWGWGNNYHDTTDTAYRYEFLNSNLGIEDYDNKHLPITKVNNDTNWKSIGLGGNFNIGLKDNGSLFSLGTLNNGTLQTSLTEIEDTNSTDFYSNPDSDNKIWKQIESVVPGSFLSLRTVLAIKTDGTLWAWGHNQGMYGNGTVESKDYPVQIGTDTWKCISAYYDGNGGGGFVFGIKEDGTAWVWGTRFFTYFYGIYPDIEPIQYTSDTDWEYVCVGGENFNISAIFIKTDGTMWGYGSNVYGQLGSSNVNIGLSFPQLTTATNWESAIIAKGQLGIYTIAKRTDGTLWSTGFDFGGTTGLGKTGFSQTNAFTKIGTATDWDKFSTRWGATLAIKTNGTLWGWGANGYGILGRGNTTNVGSPVQIGTSTWKDVKIGYYCSHLIRSDGTLWCSGQNNEGQLGRGNTTATTSLTQIGSDSDWDQPLNTYNTTFISKTNGTLYSAGNPANGSLATTPRYTNIFTNSISGQDWSKIYGSRISNISYSSIGNQYSVHLIKTNGTLWGLGRIPGPQTEHSTPTQIGTASTWESVSLGTSGNPYALGIQTNGTLWAWGDNSNNRLGLGGGTTRTSPVQVGTDTDWEYASANVYASYASKTTGESYGWGNNSNNYLGLPLGISSSTEFVKGESIIRDWKVINGKSNHILGITNSGTLWAWGNNANGQLGLGDTTQRTSPVQVGIDTNWESVSCGSNHSLAIKTNGTLWSWGYNGNGQLGLGNTTNRTSPVQVGTDTNWESVSCGANHTLAIKTNGTLWAWGNNGNGRLGDGTTTQRTSPVQVGTDTNWESVSCANNHTLAFKTNGTLWSWGLNTQGQLGLGDRTQRTSPVQVGTNTNWKFFTVTNSGSLVIKNTY